MRYLAIQAAIARSRPNSIPVAALAQSALPPPWFRVHGKIWCLLGFDFDVDSFFKCLGRYLKNLNLQ
jgi:hypothetical protein